jgi:hypothetical protein
MRLSRKKAESAGARAAAKWMWVFLFAISVRAQLPVLPAIGGRLPQCDLSVISDGLIEGVLCNGVISNLNFFGVQFNDTRCGKFCTSYACALRVMGCATEYNALAAKYSSACHGALNCGALVGITPDDCSVMSEVLTTFKIPTGLFGIKIPAAVCASTWQVGGEILEFVVPPVGALLTMNGGPCGTLCQDGVCAMNIFSCPQAPGESGGVQVGSSPFASRQLPSTNWQPSHAAPASNAPTLRIRAWVACVPTYRRRARRT